MMKNILKNTLIFCSIVLLLNSCSATSEDPKPDKNDLLLNKKWKLIESVRIRSVSTTSSSAQQVIENNLNILPASRRDDRLKFTIKYDDNLKKNINVLEVEDYLEKDAAGDPNIYESGTWNWGPSQQRANGEFVYGQWGNNNDYFYNSTITTRKGTTIPTSSRTTLNISIHELTTNKLKIGYNAISSGVEYYFVNTYEETIL